MSAEVDTILTDEAFEKWKSNLRNLSKTELLRKEAAILHALETKRRTNTAAGLSSEADTERLTAQLEACYNELAVCDLQPLVLAMNPGMQPVGTEEPLELGSIKCKLCAIPRKIIVASADVKRLSAQHLDSFKERAFEKVIADMTNDHRFVGGHKNGISVKVTLKA